MPEAHPLGAGRHQLGVTCYQPGVLRCKLDGKDYKDCESPKTYKDLAKGEHHFKVKAQNAQGAKDPSPAKKSFKI